MRKQLRYQSIIDLKNFRKKHGYTKEDIANIINYSIRTVERIEEENAVREKNSALILCELYNLDFNEFFYEINIATEKIWNRYLAEEGEKPNNEIVEENKYYYLYIRKTGGFKRIVASKLKWVKAYNRNKDVRVICEVNARVILEYKPNTVILNNKKEWDYWYYSICTGKDYNVIVSEACLQSRLPYCLKEVIVKNKDLHVHEGISDYYMW